MYSLILMASLTTPADVPAGVFPLRPRAGCAGTVAVRVQATPRATGCVGAAPKAAPMPAAGAATVVKVQAVTVKATSRSGLVSRLACLTAWRVHQAKVVAANVKGRVASALHSPRFRAAPRLALLTLRVCVRCR